MATSVGGPPVASAQIRRAFIDYFARLGHTVVPGASLVPATDPSLLFTNAGMVQFKDVLLGAAERPYRRAVSAQLCMRAGGKHNDLDNVGYTLRHQTLFEMLGNFSFGDYFKREAITYAWEFLTGILSLPAARLSVTVHVDDDEAMSIWRDDVGLPAERLSRHDADNFWQMADTGPCGPCSEIFYDHGDVAGADPDDEDRRVEIWNLVFMQYQRCADGETRPLEQRAVDTGMGLERVAAVMQGVRGNYQTDVLGRLVAAAAELTACQDADRPALRVLADHIRACAFLICDGVLPGNEGRAYVLRRIIRRAVGHGHQLGMRRSFMADLLPALIEVMGQDYPMLAERRAHIARSLALEEDQFLSTLDQGMKMLERLLGELSGDAVPGEAAFQLYDTYGFPVDMTCAIASARGFSVDMAGFDEAMAAQRERARARHRFDANDGAALRGAPATDFTGYRDTELAGATVVGLLVGGQAVDCLSCGQRGGVVLDRTPFYAESGGQAGDAGELGNALCHFAVADTQRAGDSHVHAGLLERGTLMVGDRLDARVDRARRAAVAQHHSATHLLHAALRRTLGEHVVQRGSLVEANRLRFDFSHAAPLNDEQRSEVEAHVNAVIRGNAAVAVDHMPLARATELGAVALFGERYGEEVRVVGMGDGFSTELCGGTHVGRVGELECFKILSETAIASGVRRIEAVVGAAAFEWLDARSTRLDALCDMLKADESGIVERVRALDAENRALASQLAALQRRVERDLGRELAAGARTVDGVAVLAEILERGDAKALRGTLDALKQQLGPAAIVLASVQDGKVVLVAGVDAQWTERLDAGALVRHVASQVGGRGGGRADMAQGGGSDPDSLPQAMASVPDWVSERLAESA